MQQAEILEATPEKLPDGTIDWTLCHAQGTNKACGDEPGKFPPVSVAKGKADVPFKITITGDQTGLEIKYAPEPIWSQWNPKTSGPWTTAPSPANVDQIVGIQGAGTTVLQFRDTNTKEGTITYQLNFVDKSGKKVNSLDPEIKNGGEGIIIPTDGTGFTGTGTSQSLWSRETVAVALVAAVLLLLIGIWIGRKMGR